MSPGIYNGTQAQAITLSVASDAQKPLSVKFNASRSKIFSGDSILFDWGVLNGSGVNIKFTCSPLLQIRAFSVSTTTTLACGDYAWPANFASVGSTSVTFISSNATDEVSTVTLFPVLKSGVYDGNNAQMIRVIVAPVPKTPLPPKTLSPLVPTHAITQPSVAVTPSSSVIPAASATIKNVFTKTLAFGSRSAEVNLLQKFLATDKSLYPERLVTGYFGPATKRAVGRFQIKFGLIKDSKHPAYGVVGPKTRFSLNALQ